MFLILFHLRRFIEEENYIIFFKKLLLKDPLKAKCCRKVKRAKVAAKVARFLSEL